MADLKISQLNSIVTVVPATDVLPVVQGATTYKMTPNQILGSGGVATLASATITGAATVGTTLGVTGNLTVAGSGPHRFGTTHYSQFDQSSLQFVGSRSTPGTLCVYSNTNRLCFQGDTGGYLFQNGANTLTLLSIANDATQVTLNSTGLGLGVSPAQKLDVDGNIRMSGVSGGTRFLLLNADNTYTGSLTIQSGGGSASYGAATILYGNSHATYPGGVWIGRSSGSTGPIMFGTGGVSPSTIQMSLDTSGNLLVGTINTSATAGPGFKSQFSSTVPQFAIVANEAGTSTSLSIYNVSAAAYRFYVNNGGTVFATNTTISAISDARLKENVQDIDVGLGAILALKPRKFDWKAGKGKDIKGDRGFIAQEFETVFPNLIDEWADPAPEGEAPYKSVRQDLIPVLVKAIQELTARVQTLEAR